MRSWYTTRDDPNNVKVDLYMKYSENRGSTWSSPIQEITIPASGQTIPWNYHIQRWDDYQSAAPDPLHGSFLDAWSADGRNTTTSSIFSTILN